MTATTSRRRLALALLLTLGACCGDRHRLVTATTFLAAAGRGVGTLHAQTLLGCHDGRVWLRVWSQHPLWGTQDDVYSVPLGELPADLQPAFAAGINPLAQAAPTSITSPPSAAGSAAR